MENFLEYRINLKQNPFLIKDLSPDDEDYELLCEDAVRINGLVLEFIDYTNMSNDKYESICADAVWNIHEAMKFVDPNKVKNYYDFCWTMLEGRGRTCVGTCTKGIY